jgi:hypothetical protein
MRMRTCAWGEFSKWKNSIIEDHIPRDVHMTTGHIKALKPFVKIAITQEHTLLRTKLKFVSVKGLKIGPTAHPKV